MRGVKGIGRGEEMKGGGGGGRRALDSAQRCWPTLFSIPKPAFSGAGSDAGEMAIKCLRPWS